MDRTLIYVQLTLGALGVLGVASSVPSAWPQHLIRILLAFGLTIIIARVPIKTIIRLSPLAYIVSLLLLVLVLLPGIGIAPDGSSSQRWLLIPGIGITLQPSELMKVAVIAYLTAFFYNHIGNWEIWRPMLVIGLAAGMIILEPDFSTAAFIFCLAFAMLLLAGTTLVRLISITAAAAIIAGLMISLYISPDDGSSYLVDRIMAFWEMLRSFGDNVDADIIQTIGYQPWRAHLALRRSGLWGVGPSTPSHVPEADTDMIAIAIAHSLGFIGIATLFALYFILAGRGLKIASLISGPGALLAAGATVYICAQAALNLMVASNLFPITGVPLPFVSYGMNSLISVGIAMGFIHGAYRHARAQGIDI